MRQGQVIVLWLCLAGCGPTGGVDGVDPSGDDATDDGGGAADDDNSTGDDDSASPAPSVFEHECEGTASYYFTWPVQVAPGTVPPDLTLWDHYNQAYQEWQEARDEANGDEYEQPAEWLSTNDFSVDAAGNVLGWCSWIDYSDTDVWDPPFTGFYFDRFTLLVAP